LLYIVHRGFLGGGRMSVTVLLNLAGMLMVLLFCWLISNNREKIDRGQVLRAIGYQVVFAVIILKLPLGIWVMDKASAVVNKVISYGDEGLAFVFGALADVTSPPGYIFIIHALGNIIFLAALVEALFYLGILPAIIRYFGLWVKRLTGATELESFVAVSNVFLGDTQAPLLIGRYLPVITRSEMSTILISGMGSMSVNILGGYASLGIPVTYLLTASALVPFGSLAISKLVQPLDEEACQLASITLDDSKSGNVIEALADGAACGMRMVLGIAATLVAFVALVPMVNDVLAMTGLSLEQILSWIFYPAACLMGLPSELTTLAGQLLGTKMVLNEFVSFTTLGKLISQLDQRSAMMLTVAMAGFANLGSMGICIAGIGELCPEKKSMAASMIFKTMLGGFCVSLFNAMLVGLIMAF